MPGTSLIYENEGDHELLHMNLITLGVIRSLLELPWDISVNEAVVLQAVSIGRIRRTPYNLSAIVALTGLPKSTVRRVLDGLVKRGVLRAEVVHGTRQFSFCDKMALASDQAKFIASVKRSIRNCGVSKLAPISVD